MVKVLGISASPRKSGNSDTLLEGFLSGARQAGASVEKLVLNDLAFRPCQECGGCDKTGVCVLSDDLTAVYEKVARADVIAIATPLFFRSVSAQAKMMIDRFHCLWVAANILKMPPRPKGARGVFICASADTKEGACDSARSLVRIFFNTIGMSLSDELVCSGVDAAGDIQKREDALKAAADLGRSMALPRKD